MGAIGLITYMRTDSTNVSREALESARKFIAENLGDAYLPQKPNYYSSKKNAQEAHEAIRPTDAAITPESIRQYLKDDEYKLYELIWRRFVASQMTPARWFITIAEIQADTTAGKAVFPSDAAALETDQGRTIGFVRATATRTAHQGYNLYDPDIGQSVGVDL